MGRDRVAPRAGAWIETGLVGMGPNKRYETDQDCAPLSMPITVGYNPSNGTMSAGDIHWFGPGSLTSVSPTIGS